MALRISVKDNGTDLTGDEIYVEDDGFRDFKTERNKRINIDYAEEAKDFCGDIQFNINKLDKYNFTKYNLIIKVIEVV